MSFEYVFLKTIMKKIKFRSIISLSLLFVVISNFSFSQVKLPISGDYKVVTETYFDEIKIEGSKIVTFQKGQPLRYFIAVEEKLGQYILEMVKEGVNSVDKNTKRDRKLVVAKIEYLTEKECHLSLVQPNGTIEKVKIQKQ